VKSEIATFFEVFPHGTIWSNDQGGWGYDLVMLGQQEPLRVDPDELQRRLSQPDHAAALRSLEHVGFQTVIGLFASYAGQARDLRPWLEDAQINRDRNLRLQYLAGMELNNNQGEAIYREMASYRRFPDEIFTGTGLYSQMLRVALEQSIAVFQSAPRE
jgi:spermidine synthase